MSVNVVGFTNYPLGILTDADYSIFFLSNPGIWQREGKETGISLVFPLSGSEDFSEFEMPTSLSFDRLFDSGAGGNGKVLFPASENEFGKEPWISDGTP